MIACPRTGSKIPMRSRTHDGSIISFPEAGYCPFIVPTAGAICCSHSAVSHQRSKILLMRGYAVVSIKPIWRLIPIDFTLLSCCNAKSCCLDGFVKIISAVVPLSICCCLPALLRYPLPMLIIEEIRNIVIAIAIMTKMLRQRFPFIIFSASTLICLRVSL